MSFFRHAAILIAIAYIVSPHINLPVKQVAKPADEYKNVKYKWEHASVTFFMFISMNFSHVQYSV